MQTNRLLASLRRNDRQRIIAACAEVELLNGEVLCKPQNRIKHAYFPIDGFISQLVPVDSRENLELALVGNEGMVGTALLLGVNSSTMQSLVQGSGAALRISAVAFRRELEQCPALRQKLQRYVHVLQAQLAMTAACMSFHSLDRRLARWLLMTHDLAGPGGFHLTHKFLAQMLGVRRVGITNAAGILRERGILRYSRGEITILDRGGLEQVSCTCYQASKQVYESVLG